MASVSSRSKSLLERTLSNRRSILRKLLVESLERRELMAVGPRLLSIATNSGSILDANSTGLTANVQSESPSEIVFRFDGAQSIAQNSLNGIQIFREGNVDGDFATGTTIPVVPSYIGFGDTQQIVVARFSGPLPDDSYRIEVLGGTSLTPVRDVSGNPLRPRTSTLDRDTYFMNLELGALVSAVVPQPIDRSATGVLTQRSNQIDVYFNNDRLNLPASSTAIADRNYFQLILTQNSARPNDDLRFIPDTVNYDPVANKVTLIFGNPLESLTGVGGAGTFRLRIGSNDVVTSLTNPNTPAFVTPAGDVGDSRATASTILGTFNNAPVSTVISASVTATPANQLLLNYPGSNSEPGHRNTQDESHLLGGADGNLAISTIFYNFSENRSYGTGSDGRPLFSSMTSDQKQRVREIFEFYSAQLGVDVVESADQGLTIVVGDLFPLNNPPEPFEPAGIAGGSLAIMNGRLTWNNGLGQSFFDTALHEIGHLLGLGHTYEQPVGTVMGSDGALASANPIEWFFPGDIDVEHGQHIHRPDNRDVDMYRFDVAANQAGTVSIETIAERLANSSNLDSYLTLLRYENNQLKVVSINDNYFSKDSLIKADVTPGTYFIAVTSRGNETSNLETAGTGSGGTSQGSYQLRVDFKPTATSSLSDTSGTLLDGDADGKAGGNFDFWFRVAAPVGTAAVGAPKTIFVDKDSTASTPDGSLASPYRIIPDALAASSSGDIVRLLASVGADNNIATQDDNVPYEIGDGGLSVGTLDDGSDLQVPKGVTLVIDSGAIVKVGSSSVLVGSSDSSVDRSSSAIQVLGTPNQSVYFTSYLDQSLGLDRNPLNTTPQNGNWGGIEIRNDVDRAQGRFEYEREGIFLNFIAYANMSYGGGVVGQGNQSRVVTPISLTEARPTILNNRITNSADAGISADPNSFEETLFSEPRYQLFGAFTADYSRVGPQIRGNSLTSNSTNGLFIRIDTLAGQELQTLKVAARLDDTDITYVLGENLVIQGTPGGSFFDSSRSDISLVTLNNAAGGTLAAGSYFYRLSNVDGNGNESLPSTVIGGAAGIAVAAGANRSVAIGSLPRATGDFVGRRLYRNSLTVPGTWDLVANLDRDTTFYTDSGSTLIAATTLSTAANYQRARPHGSLVVDPGIVMKSFGARIEVGIGGHMIAEGTSSRPIVFTSRRDDRYGAGGTFDTNNDGAVSTPVAGDWSGIVARHLSTLNIDSSLITYGGGNSSIAGGFASFNAVEIHQSTARIANSVLENNAAGNANPGSASRDYRGPNDASTIYVVGSQPVILNNIIRNNGGAAVSVDANSMKAISVVDNGRVTGVNNRTTEGVGNLGPLVRKNSLATNAINGMRIRGATLTTEAVWDDTDMVHVLQSEIIIPDFHTYGGLRLQSRAGESLVVKLNTVNPNNPAGITASGRPLDINDRIGGSLYVIGAPGFPVVMTSLSDDSIGAGFEPTGRPQNDTNNNGPSVGTVGDWRSIRLNPFSNDRNVDTTVELESDKLQNSGTNDIPGSAQSIGILGNNLNGGDENVRLGFTIAGTIAVASDLDVYRFTGTAGTSVWFDIDRTGAALDSIVELVDSNGFIIAQSDNSYNESLAGSVYSDPLLIAANQALPMEQNTFLETTTSSSSVATDFQSINPLDAGFRITLPGVSGTITPYYIRVRSSNSNPTAEGAARNGITSGPYRLQIRLQQEDEIAGSTIRYADVRYAGNGIEVLGLPGHSPLVSDTSERAQPTSPSSPQPLGNIGNLDRAALSVAGSISATGNVDWYSFNVQRDSIQAPANHTISTVFDIDYGDGLGRPDTSLWVFQVVPGGGLRLVYMGTDSNIADDQSNPTTGVNDLTQGSFGGRDPFIGAQALPQGQYYVAVTNASRAEAQIQQFSQANAGGGNVLTVGNALIRLEPLNGFQRIIEDRFEAANLAETALGAKQTAFTDLARGGTNNSIPFTLADVTLFAAQANPSNANQSRLLFGNPLTGAKEAEVSTFTRVNDIAVSPAGRTIGAVNPVGTVNDASAGALLNIDSAGDGATSALQTGIQTFATRANATTGNAEVFQENVGTVFTALSYTDNNNTLNLFGVARRTQYRSAAVDTNGAITGFGPNVGPLNLLYRLSVDTGAAISMPGTGFGDRAGDRRATGAGTNIREFGEFDATTGLVTGLAQVGDNLYGVTDLGELLRMPIGNFQSDSWNDTLVTTINDPVSNTPIVFTGLSKGPRNVEGGIYANMLFGITQAGTLYAFNTNGVLQNVFPGALSYRTSPGAADGMGTVQGIDFAALDVNLWHVTDTQGNVAGHGRPVTFDLSRSQTQAGTNSLYFGYEPTGPNQIPGTWNGIYNAAATAGQYNFAGGAAGAVESDPIDLRGYSADDLPTLYFTYKATTEQSNSPNTDGAPMLDAFRVYALREDGTSVLLATNNASDDNNYTNGNNEFDPSISGNVDRFGKEIRSQTLFDSLEAGDQGTWRQARISLGSIAGQKNIRLRFEFSTGGDFQTADALRGGEELIAIAGSQITDGNTFTINPGAGAPIAGARTFEFDLGLVLNIPSGASVASGNTITVQGRTFTFRTTATGAPREIVYNTTDSPATLAAKVRGALIAGGAFTVTANSDSPNMLNVTSGNILVTAGGTHQVTGLDAAIIRGRPGVGAGNVSIPVNQSMTAIQIRDAIRTALATTFNAVGQAANTSVWKVNNNSIKLYGYSILDPGVLGARAALAGDQFGATTTNNRFTSEAQRAQRNGFEGIFVDDIVIGLAERGEQVLNYNIQELTGFVANTNLSSGGFLVGPVSAGTYQLNIRTAAEYYSNEQLLAVADPKLVIGFDTNDRLAQQVNLIVSGQTLITDGDRFTLSDGITEATFEFDVVTSLVDRAVGVRQGNIVVSVTPSATNNEIARAIRNAINSPAAQSILKITASTDGDMLDTGGGDIEPNQSSTIRLFGSAASTRLGNLTITSTAGLTLSLSGATGLGETLGDSNRRRDQGQIVISSSTFRDNVQFGILIDDAARNQTALGGNIGDRPYPGSAANLNTLNNANIAPGIVVAGNIVSGNGSGGIQLGGDPASSVLVPNAISSIARVYNNTIFGTGTGSGIGIEVRENASPTILNNIISNYLTGVELTNAGASTVLGSNIYKNNGANVNGGGVGSSAITLATTDPLFANPANNRFYLATQSQAIDSALGSLAEIGALTQVKNSVNLPLAPLVASDRDVNGILRVDDLTMNNTSGQGQSVIIDRGAVERGDTTGIIGVLLQPLDNDIPLVDVDRNSTFVKLSSGNLDYFSILLQDNQGIGPDPSSVTSNNVMLTENGRLLVPGTDYVFGYDSNSRTIRLTPFAGFWRQDSVYEITLNNAPKLRLTATAGDTITDGAQMVVTRPGGGTATLEFDSMYTLTVNPVGITDGQGFTYTPAGGTAVNFEFQYANTGTVAPGNRPIYLAAGDSVTTIANKIADAIRSVIGAAGDPVRTNGTGTIFVGGEAGDRITNVPTSLTLTGSPGVSTGAIRVPFIPSATFTADQVAGSILRALNSLPTSNGVRAVGLGTDTIVVSGVTSITGASTLALPAIVDFAGNAVQTNRSNGLTQFTIAMPQSSQTNAALGTTGPVYDYGDSNATGLKTLVIDNGARHSIFPIDIPVLRLGTLVDSEANGVPTATANGDNNNGGNDEDGITTVGLFNVLLPAPTIVASVVGIGYLDGWIDWNNDGDVLDPGEKVIDSQPVSDGANRFLVTMPNTLTSSATGNRNARFRLSSTGGLQTTGVGLGGEVEDYVITLTPGTPPTAVNDAYAIDENLVLTVPAATGVVSNDTDADVGAVITVADNDPVTAGVQPVSGPAHGTLTLNANGSFTYTPVQFYAGPDSFVYAITDGTFPGLTFGTVSITVNPINQPPQFTVGTNQVNAENLLATPPLISVPWATNILAGPPTAFDELSGPTSQTVSFRVSVPLAQQALFDTLPAISPTGVLTYKLKQYANGQAVVTVIAEDTGPNTPAPNDNNSNPVSFTITVTEINQAPIAGVLTRTTLENTATTTAANSTAVPINASAITAVGARGPAAALVPALPGNENNQVLTVTRVDATSTQGGTIVPVFNAGILTSLTYTPRFSFNGQDTFTYTLTDNGTTNGAANPLSVTGTITINIGAVNQPPQFTAGPNQVITEPLTTAGTSPVVAWATNILAGPPEATDENSGPTAQTVRFLVTNNNNALFSVQPAISPTGQLTYQVAQYVNGSAVVTVVLQDSLGNVLPDRNSSNPISFTITVTEINQAPIAGSFTTTTLENTATTTSANTTAITIQSSTITALGVNGPAGALNPALPGNELGQVRTITRVDATSARGGTIVPVMNPSGVVTSFRYTPLFSFNGQDTFTYTLTDNGTTNGAADPRSVTGTITVNITAVNQPPQFTAGPNQRISEPLTATGTSPVVAWATNILAGPPQATDENSGPTAQTVQFLVTNNNNALFSVQPAISPTGQLTYQVAQYVNGSAVVTVVLRDSAGNTLPDRNSSNPISFTITVTEINQAPLAGLYTTTTLENTATTTAANTTAITIQSSTITALGTNAVPGALNPALPGNELPQVRTITRVDATSLRGGTIVPVVNLAGVVTSFTYTPLFSFNGQDTFTYTLSDNGTTNGTANPLTVTGTITVNVTAVNQPPQFTAGANQSITEPLAATGTSQSVAWATNILAGPPQASDENSGATRQNVQFLVTNSNNALFSVQPAISPTGQLTYQVAQYVNGTAVVTVVLRDSGNSTLPDVRDSNPISFTITVTEINQAPIAGNYTTTTLENTVATVAGNQTTLNIPSSAITSLGFNAPAGALIAALPGNERGQTLSITRIDTVSARNGVIQPVTVGGVITSFLYTPAFSFNGDDAFTYTLTDNGTTNGAANPLSVTGTVTVRVNAVNQPPQFTPGTNQSIAENTQPADLSVNVPWASNILAGPLQATDEISGATAQSVTFVVTNNNNALFTVQPSISPTGRLTYSLPQNANGQAIVTVFARDNGSNAAPNDNESDPVTFIINVTEVNNAPIPGNFVTTTAEDTVISVNTSGIIALGRPGPANEGTQQLTITQMVSRSSQQGSVVPVFTNGVITSFRYTPAPNFVGQDTIQYILTDNGTTNGAGDPLGTVGLATINVTSVNDAPQFVPGPNIFIDENSPTVTEPWASAISAGPLTAIDELNGTTAQSVSFLTTNNNNALFSVQPTINAAGEITYRPALDANGTAVVSVVAIDTGSGTQPNINRSLPYSLTITVRAINQPPVFTVGPTVTANEDSGAYSQTWATRIFAAPGLATTPQTALDEATQNITFTVNFVTPAQQSLFTVLPTISPTGILSFTPASNSIGDVVLTVQAQDDGSNVLPNSNTSALRTFTIRLVEVNDPPVGVADNYTTTENDALTITAPGLLSNDTDIDLPNDTLSVILGNRTSSFGATVSVLTDGSFVYNPLTSARLQALLDGQFLDDTFVYITRDAGGLQSAQTTVTVRVTGINDAPGAIDDNYTVPPDVTTFLTVLSNDVDPDNPLNPSSVEAVIQPSHGIATVQADGRIAYRPNPGFVGQDVFTYRVRDGLGLLSNEARVTINVSTTQAPVANADSATTQPKVPVIISVLSNDTDINGNTTINASTVTIVQAPANGTAVKKTDGTIEYTPRDGFTGTDTLSYTVRDNSGLISNSAIVTIRVSASAYQNPAIIYDVNNDGVISSIDPLLVINQLSRRGPGVLPPGLNIPFIDVNGDGTLNSIDVLVVINQLARRSSGEGESTAATTVSQPVPALAPVYVSSTIAAGTLTSLAVTDSIVSGTMRNAPTGSPTPVVTSAQLLSAINEDDDGVDAIAIESNEANQVNPTNLDSVFANDFDDLGIN